MLSFMHMQPHAHAFTPSCKTCTAPQQPQGVKKNTDPLSCDTDGQDYIYKTDIAGHALYTLDEKPPNAVLQVLTAHE